MYISIIKLWISSVNRYDPDLDVRCRRARSDPIPPGILIIYLCTSIYYQTVHVCVSSVWSVSCVGAPLLDWTLVWGGPRCGAVPCGSVPCGSLSFLCSRRSRGVYSRDVARSCSRSRSVNLLNQWVRSRFGRSLPTSPQWSDTSRYFYYLSIFFIWISLVNGYDPNLSLPARYLEQKTRRFFYFFGHPPSLFPRVNSTIDQNRRSG